MIHIQKGDKTRSTDKRMGNRYAFTGDNGIPGHCQERKLPWFPWQRDSVNNSRRTRFSRILLGVDFFLEARFEIGYSSTFKPLQWEYGAIKVGIILSRIAKKISSPRCFFLHASF